MTPDPSSLPLALKVTFMVLAMVGNGIAVLMNTAMNSVNGRIFPRFYISMRKKSSLYPKPL